MTVQYVAASEISLPSNLPVPCCETSILPSGCTLMLVTLPRPSPSSSPNAILNQSVITGKVVKDYYYYYYYSTGDGSTVLVLQQYYATKKLSDAAKKIILNTGNRGILLSIIFVLQS